jgi:uncharacterized protein YdhG (YjbR/CyaY superfamily)
MNKPANIDAYISGFPEDKQVLLEQIRETIKKAAPQAVEVISYGMPAFKQNGVLVWFAAFKNHIGFYPFPSGIEAFKEELSMYKGSKGSIHFPLDKPLPLNLITVIVNFRLSENTQK